METPEVWYAVIDYLLEPLVNSWEERRMGFSLGHSTTDFRIITHAVWADNVVVFASDSVALQQMLSELAQAIAEGRFRWKPSSLEVLQSSGTEDNSKAEFAVQQCGETLVYNHVSRLALLGDIFDHTGSTELSRAHRQGIVDAIFYKHKQLFQHPGPMCPRLKA